MNDRELENTVQDGSVCVCGHTNLPYMNIHAHPNTHTEAHITVHAHNRTRLLSLPFQNPPTNINRDCSEGCVTAKIYVRDIHSHKSLGTYVGLPVSATVGICICRTYLLSAFRYVAIASLRAHSSSRACMGVYRKRATTEM